MDTKIIKILFLIGAIFGFLGGTVAFLRAYDGYSHFPGIPKKKRLMMSLEYAGLTFVFIIGIIIIVIILYYKGMI
jgi:hypothetical protein